MLLVVSILSASCIFDGERCFIVADELQEIIFTVSLEGQRTRATWDDYYTSEDGLPFDFRINPEGLRVVVMKDGEHLGQVSDISYWPINEEHTEFKFIGRMPVEFVEHINNFEIENLAYKFMVFANTGDDVSGMDDITYNYAQLDTTSESSAIPMWGVKEVDVKPLLDGYSLDLGTISLLRAAAKVQVKLNEGLKDRNVTIKSAVLKYYNQTGYVLPSGWEQVSNTDDLNQDNCIRVYRHAAVNMPLVKDAKSGDYYIYIAEYDNINYPGERNKISLEFTVGDEDKYFEDAISFCQYHDGEPLDNSHYNIVRNHIYEFEIMSIAGSNLVLDYHVANWATEDWDGNGAEYKEHDLSYPTYHNPVVPREFFTSYAQEQISYAITKEPTMYYGGKDNLEAGCFECYFQILAPDLVEWKPVFMGSKENYRIRVYRVGANMQPVSASPIFDTAVSGLQYNLGVCDDGEWFRIVVFPLSDDGADTTSIEFGISYYQEWTDQYINLYVNGEYNNIRWPNSGDNPKIISIRHISAN